MPRRFVLIAAVLFAVALALALAPRGQEKPQRNGWIRVQLAGTPREIGSQHGRLLAHEIDDMRRVAELELTHDTPEKPYAFYRQTAQEVFWPHIEQEYRDELTGIADGAAAKGVKIDVWDVVAMNALMELGYYTRWYDEEHKIKPAKKTAAPEHCSAFIATGSYTKDGRVVIAHNNWTGYLDGSRWNIIFDVKPVKGHRFLMDGLPGFIHSGDDFGVNSAGLAITETTITRFNGFDPGGVPEFVRARKAMQYAGSIDEFAGLMRAGNNGGYANNWLVADTNTNEIADLELGLKNVTLLRSKNGYFVGTNFPLSDKLRREETEFDPSDMGASANARRVRAEALVQQAKGTIDLAFAKKYLSDHYDSYAKREEADERSLCGHIELSPRGSKPWQPEWGPAGTAQAKAADESLIRQMSFEASFGHPCGMHFKSAAHIGAHPEFAWAKGLMRDLPSFPWTRFEVSR